MKKRSILTHPTLTDKPRKPLSQSTSSQLFQVPTRRKSCTGVRSETHLCHLNSVFNVLRPISLLGEHRNTASLEKRKSLEDLKHRKSYYESQLQKKPKMSDEEKTVEATPSAEEREIGLQPVVDEAPAQPEPEPETGPTPEPGTEPVSGPGSRPVSQPVSRPVSQPVSQTVSQAVSQPVSQPVSQTVSRPVSRPISGPGSPTISVRLVQSETTKSAEHRESVLSNFPLDDSDVLLKWKDADKRARTAVAEIEEMKRSITKFQQKDDLTPEEARDLQQKQAQLIKKLSEFEAITRDIQRLIGLADMSSTELRKTQPSFGGIPATIPEEEEGPRTYQERGVSSEYPADAKPFEPKKKPETLEEMLPKVIICNVSKDDPIPRLIFCDKNQAPASQHKPPCEGLVESLTGLLTASYSIQEKLACENAEMEGDRYQLQEELLTKDQILDNLQRKVASLQAEMRLVVKENADLQQTVASLQDKGPQPICKRDLLMKAMGKDPDAPPCGQPTNEELEKQLAQIECDVCRMQAELCKVQQERKTLELQRKLLKCTGTTDPRCKKQEADLQMRNLKEQYSQLLCDFNGKLAEISAVRVELENAKKEGDEWHDKFNDSEARVTDLIDRLKCVETERNKLLVVKDQLLDMELQMAMAKQRYREGQDEVDEMKNVIQEQASQLEEYRNKYLSAQQTVEEQRRELDMMEIENQRINEQVNLEIQRVKAQFQEKLQELTPLPEILKATQIKLQESQQLRNIAERNCEDLGTELQDVRDLNQRLNMMIEELRNSEQMTADERTAYESSIEKADKKYEEAQAETTKLKLMVSRFEDLAAQTDRRMEEKSHEVLQLMNQMETLREESARLVARTKDRGDAARRTMQCQISELERQLAQSRAMARTAQKDRDEIRQRMQSQITQLSENIEQAEMRIRTLQTHVTHLKMSYSNIFAPDQTACVDAANTNMLQITGECSVDYNDYNSQRCSNF